MKIISSGLVRVMISPLRDWSGKTATPYSNILAAPNMDPNQHPDLTSIVYTLDMLIVGDEYVGGTTSELVLDISEEMDGEDLHLPNEKYTDLCVEFNDVAMPILWLAAAPPLASAAAMVPNSGLNLPTSEMDFVLSVPSKDLPPQNTNS